MISSIEVCDLGAYGAYFVEDNRIAWTLYCSGDSSSRESGKYLKTSGKFEEYDSERRIYAKPFNSEREAIRWLKANFPTAKQQKVSSFQNEAATRSYKI